MVNSSKRLFGDFKRRTIYFQLSEKWSRQYVEDKDFQRLLLSKVENGWNQINIYLRGRNQREEDLDLLEMNSTEETPVILPAIDLPIHRISINFLLAQEYWNNYKSIRCYSSIGALKISPIPNVRELELNLKGELNDLTPFKSLSRLILRNESLTSNTVLDITPISQVTYLTIQNFVNITDFSIVQD